MDPPVSGKLSFPLQEKYRYSSNIYAFNKLRYIKTLLQEMMLLMTLLQEVMMSLMILLQEVMMSLMILLQEVRVLRRLSQLQSMATKDLVNDTYLKVIQMNRTKSCEEIPLFSDAGSGDSFCYREQIRGSGRRRRRRGWIKGGGVEEELEEGLW